MLNGRFSTVVFFLLLCFKNCLLVINTSNNLISIAVLVRNKAHYLPFFFACLENQTYPKENQILHFLIDANNSDKSFEFVDLWTNSTQSLYKKVIVNVTDGPKINNSNPWNNERLLHVTQLRDLALQTAIESHSSYLMLIDVDVLLTSTNAITDFVEAFYDANSKLNGNVLIYSPLLNCTDSPSYANFWGAISKDGFYSRSEDYFDILNRHKIGYFEVPLVNSIFILNLPLVVTEGFKFQSIDKDVSDDLASLALNIANTKKLAILDNSKFFGYFPSSLDALPGSQKDIAQFTHLQMEIMLGNQIDFDPIKMAKVFLNILSDNETSEIKSLIEPPPKSRLLFDKIFMINMASRTLRKSRMEYCFDLLGLEVQYFPAVEGNLLSAENLTEMNIKEMPDFLDPYHKRKIKMGEIGCFLSHYNIWKSMVENNYEVVFVLEDDIRFEMDFTKELIKRYKLANKIRPDWELLYIGRKRMSQAETPLVESNFQLVYPNYTYWTLSYILKQSGAIKLLAQDPLKHILPVDEYMPIMFDQHPEEAWKKYFHPRNLVAISAEPLLVEPTHYTGQPYHFSDTELSVQLTDFFKTDEFQRSEF